MLIAFNVNAALKGLFDSFGVKGMLLACVFFFIEILNSTCVRLDNRDTLGC
jgi:hypothetical protein